MNANEQLIHTFYTAFSKRDYKTMQQCYADNATFSDAVFTNLDGKEVRAMWEMLCSSSSAARIEFDSVKAEDGTGSANWTAHYTFSATGKKVVNRIHASFVFENGKIVQHKDHFSFYKWASQALGTPGVLLGWTPLIRNKVRKTAAKNLQAFMAKKKAE